MKYGLLHAKIQSVASKGTIQIQIYSLVQYMHSIWLNQIHVEFSLGTVCGFKRYNSGSDISVYAQYLAKSGSC